MMQRLKNIIVAVMIALTGTLVFVPAIASADFKNDACEGVNTLNGTGGSTCSTTASSSLNTILSRIIQILSVIVGFVAVIMIIVGGIKFITAGGDSGAIASARNTIIYALVGLIIVAVAQVLVHFVLRKAT